MNTAKKGANLERYIRQLFEQDGWSVIRGASSKGEALGWKSDLVATKFTDQNKREVWMAIMQMKVKRR